MLLLLSNPVGGEIVKIIGFERTVECMMLRKELEEVI